MDWLKAAGWFGFPNFIWAGLGALFILLGLLVALVAGVNHALAEAKQSGRDEIQAQWDAEKAGAEKARADLSDALSEAFAGLDGSLQSFAKTITVKGQQITVRVKKEMDNDPRYVAPECSLTDSVFEQVNAARGLSSATAPTGVRSVPVSTSGAAVRFELGGTGPR